MRVLVAERPEVLLLVHASYAYRRLRSTEQHLRLVRDAAIGPVALLLYVLLEHDGCLRVLAMFKLEELRLFSDLVDPLKTKLFRIIKRASIDEAAVVLLMEIVWACFDRLLLAFERRLF